MRPGIGTQRIGDVIEKCAARVVAVRPLHGIDVSR